MAAPAKCTPGAPDGKAAELTPARSRLRLSPGSSEWTEGKEQLVSLVPPAWASISRAQVSPLPGFA